MTASLPSKPPSLWRVYLMFLGPMILSNILQGLSGTLNGVFIGQMLGTHALASVAGMFPIIFFFISLVIGLGAGASVLVGQAWGAREPGKVRTITGTALALGALIGLVAAVLGAMFAREAMVALGTPADVLEDALRYARVMMLMMPVLLVFILFTQLLRGVSDTISPLLALLISTTTGLILTPAFIQGWLGLPRLGILSAAVASLLSTAAAMAFLAVRLRRMGHVMAPDRKLLAAFRIDRAILASVFRIGLPTGVQMVVMSLSQLVILALVNQHGSQATAAYGAVTQVVNYVQFPALSIAITASILAAQAIGEGATERLGAILSTGLWLNVAITGSFVLLGYALSQTLLGLFLTDPAVRAQGGHLLHIMLWSLLVFGFQAMVSGIMRASGDVLVPTGITIFCILVVQMGVAWALNRRIGLEGIWIGFPVAYLAMLALQTVYYRGVWRHRTIERLV
ncbi:MAG: MATE family efflux transporter [Hydrogenophaga sp.]|jgi:putative MATE family efflux protein|uniref:MATE family efflux transporter n=1 Tax=Hydrogenophaga sp. TaxID=1904254 RepID=UPI00261E5700|nr:MATE family efflux transporter [Hydrogenophaga sp.]MDD3786761.1 MATE family efflux transporter [Hydrogenophaga sp.]MDX9969432.1 MATE family efflux transporter [Hydrogenophaga sp.]